MQHSEIINMFGGIRPLAKALGHQNPTTVQGWASNGIPKWRWHEVLECAKRRKIEITARDLENGKERRT